MVRRSLCAALAAFAVVAMAAPGWAHSAWSAYRNVDFHFEVAVPAPPTITLSSSPTAVGPMPVLQGLISQGETGLGMTALDLSKLDFDTTPEQLLQGSIKGALDNVKAALDSDNPITLDGAMGHEVTGHNDQLKIKVRIYYQAKRVIMLYAVATNGSDLSPVVARYLSSLKITP